MSYHKIQFRKGLSAAIEIQDESPPNGASARFVCQWEGEPEEKYLREYISWVCSIWVEKVKQWGVSTSHVFMLGPKKAEVWHFDPGKPPKKTVLKFEEV